MSLHVTNEFNENTVDKGRFMAQFTGQNIESGVNMKAIGSIRVLSPHPNDHTDPAAVVVELDSNNGRLKAAMDALAEKGYRITSRGNTAILDFPKIDRPPVTPQQHGQLFTAAVEAVGILRSTHAIAPEDSVKLFTALSAELMSSQPQRNEEKVDARGYSQSDINAYVMPTPISYRSDDDQYRFSLTMKAAASPAVRSITDEVHRDKSLTSMKVDPHLLPIVRDALLTAGVPVERVGDEQSVGFLALEHKQHLVANAPLCDVAAKLAELSLIPPLAVEKLSERLAQPVPDTPSRLPQGANIPGADRAGGVLSSRQPGERQV